MAVAVHPVLLVTDYLPLDERYRLRYVCKATYNLHLESLSSPPYVEAMITVHAQDDDSERIITILQSVYPDIKLRVNGILDCLLVSRAMVTLGVFVERYPYDFLDIFFENHRSSEYFMEIIESQPLIAITLNHHLGVNHLRCKNAAHLFFSILYWMAYSDPSLFERCFEFFHTNTTMSYNVTRAFYGALQLLPIDHRLRKASKILIGDHGVVGEIDRHPYFGYKASPLSSPYWSPPKSRKRKRAMISSYLGGMFTRLLPIKSQRP